MNNQNQQDLEKEFERIDTKYKQGKTLTSEETNTLCICVRQSPIHNIEEYEVCQDFWFKFLYLKSKYGYGYHPKSEPITYQEQERLNKFINEWEQEIKNEKHSESLLKYLSEEKRKEIKELKKKPDYQANPNLLRNKMRGIITHSKYIYNSIKEYYPHLLRQEQIFTINMQDIIFDEKSLIHILSRHFSETANLHRLEKSFFSEDIDLKEIDLFLEKTFQIIDNSGFMTGQNIDKIAFKYRDTIYRVWVKKDNKSYKSRGNIEVNVIGSFYPIEKSSELNDLNNNYELTIIDSNYGVYIKK